MRYEEITYKHFGRCLMLTNGVLELICSLEFGPRILSFCLCGAENIFYEQPQGAEYLTTPEGWRIYGGHRLWLAPESEKTYWPDNAPVSYEVLKSGLKLIQPLDQHLHIKKQIEIRFLKEPYSLEVAHSITNCGNSPLQGSAWSISAARPEGKLYVPFAGKPGGFAPQRVMSFWGDTSLIDPRIQYGAEQIVFSAIPSEQYFKVGLWCSEGQVRYELENQAFTKRFSCDNQRTYPDGNVNVEVYMCNHMIEIESLSPLSTLEPTDEKTHIERWRLDKL